MGDSPLMLEALARVEVKRKLAEARRAGKARACRNGQRQGRAAAAVTRPATAS